MKKSRRSLTLCFTVACSLPIVLLCGAAQYINAQQIDVQRNEQGNGARQIDEFGALYGCDSGARLDNFAIELQNNPTARGVVVLYAPQAKHYAQRVLQTARDYFVNARGFESERISTVNAGRASGEKVKTQLWLVPSGVDFVLPETAGANEYTQISGKLGEQHAYDGMPIEYDEVGSAMSFGNVTFASLADALGQQANSRAYFVTYVEPDSSPGIASRIQKSTVADFARMYGSLADRVTNIYGGHSEKPRVEIWLLPNDAPPPVADVAVDAAIKETTMVGEYQLYSLEYGKENADWARDTFGDLLRADEQMSACVIVYPPSEPADSGNESNVIADNSEADASTSESVAGANNSTADVVDEPRAKLDLTRLAETWRTELADKYKIQTHRIAILIGSIGEYETGTLQTWLVPPGAPLPDPHARLREQLQLEAESEESSESTSAPVTDDKAAPPVENQISLANKP